MSIGIFYVTIVLINIIRSGMCFKCFVCNSIDNTNCDKNPLLVAQCTFIATGCIKLTNEITEYKFVNSGGKEITVKEWDGEDAGWERVPVIKKVVIRRCANNYARYAATVGCNVIPFGKTAKETICYCERELCNQATRNRTGKSRYFLFIVLTTLYVS